MWIIFFFNKMKKKKPTKKFEFLSCWEITPATRAWSTQFFRKLSNWGPLAIDIKRSWTGTVAAGVCSSTCLHFLPKCLTSPAARKIWLEIEMSVSRLSFFPSSFFFCLLGISSKNRKDIQQQQNKISFLLFMIDIILSNLGLFIFQRFSITHPWILFLKSPPDKFERILWPAIVLRPIYWNWLIISFLLYLSVFLSIDFFLCVVHIIIYQIFKKEKKLWSTTIIWNFLLFSRVQTFRPFS